MPGTARPSVPFSRIASGRLSLMSSRLRPDHQLIQPLQRLPQRLLARRIAALEGRRTRSSSRATCSAAPERHHGGAQLLPPRRERAAALHAVGGVVGAADGARLALLASPPMRMWRKWASRRSPSCSCSSRGRLATAQRVVVAVRLDGVFAAVADTFWMQTAVFGGFQVLGAAYPTGSAGDGDGDGGGGRDPRRSRLRQNPRRVDRGRRTAAWPSPRRAKRDDLPSRPKLETAIGRGKRARAGKSLWERSGREGTHLEHGLEPIRRLPSCRMMHANATNWFTVWRARTVGATTRDRPLRATRTSDELFVRPFLWPFLWPFCPVFRPTATRRAVSALGHAARSRVVSATETSQPQRVHRSPRVRRVCGARKPPDNDLAGAWVRLSRGEGAEAHKARARAEPWRGRRGARSAARQSTRATDAAADRGAAF